MPPRQSRLGPRARNGCAPIFSTSKAGDELELRPVANEVMATFSKREDRVAYFLAVLRDETKPRPVRVASVGALVNWNCFDYKQPSGQVSSDVFSALLSLLKSEDGELRKAGASAPCYFICSHITSRKDRIARTKEALSALNAAFDVERDKDIRRYMEAYKWHLGNILNPPDKKRDHQRPVPPPAAQGPPA